MNSFFSNFELEKLIISCPNACNLFFLFLIVLLYLDQERNSNHKTKLLDKNHSTQIKGLAIVLVVLGHLWVHVTNIKPTLIFSGDAIAIFLILSGYGLTISANKGKAGIKTFARKRIKRVFIPYWITTLIFLTLDGVLLGRQLSALDFTATMFGININIQTRHIDYVRWFITFLTLWYVAFIVTVRLSAKLKIYTLLSISIAIFLTDYYITKFGWYQMFAFPVGCLIAEKYETISKFYKIHSKEIILISGITFVICVLNKIFLLGQEQINYPYILYKLVNDLNGLILAISLIALTKNWKGRGVNSVLIIIGGASYELFLIHGPILIKYNPLFSYVSNDITLIGIFPITLLALVILSHLFKEINRSIIKAFT